MMRPVPFQGHEAMVRKGIEAIKAKSGFGWNPDLVFSAVEHACDQCRAYLYVHPDFPETFGILRAGEDEFSGEGYLEIWLMYSPYKQVRDKFIPQAKDLARRIGATKLKMRSRRRGFERVGWTLLDYRFEMEV